MPAVESRIDDVYKAPMRDFVAVRTALAKTLTGDEARRIKALPKPTLVPWTVNQLYWRARPVYDRLVTVGAQLRAAQIAGLEGRPANLRGATAAHRQAVAAAIAEGLRVSAQDGEHPNVEILTKTLEALSLAGGGSEAPGRLTKILQPAGFEALAGVTVHVPARAAVVSDAVAPTPPRLSGSPFEERQILRQRAEAERRLAAEIRQAESDLQKAHAVEDRARRAWEQAKADVEAAERELAARRAR